MATQDQIVLKLKEGDAQQYIQALKSVFGGECTDNSYELHRGKTHINFYNFNVSAGFDIIVVSAIHSQPVEMIRYSDGDPDYFHFHLIKEGGYEQNFNNKCERIEAGSGKGVFIHNGLFPMKVIFSPNAWMRALAFKIKREALYKLMPKAIPTLELMFPNENPIFYHTSLPSELSSLMDDLFQFKKSEFGQIPLVIARGLELFTVLLRSIGKQVDKDELKGLHVDDYNRLLKLKDYLQSSLDQHISVEDLAKKYGISVSKLKRDFKTLFNTSVYQFYNQFRMDEAYRRLKTGKYSVMEVGYDLGYQSISKFSQMFKKVKGISPREVIPI